MKPKPTETPKIDISLHNEIVESYRYLVEIQKENLASAKEESQRYARKVKELQLFGNIIFN